MLHRLLLLLGMLAALGACQAEDAIDDALGDTFRDTYDFAALSVPLGPVEAPEIAIAVVDERPYVLSGEEKPRFVGKTPGKYRNIVPVTTASERPLADIVAEAVAEAYARQGVAATVVSTPEEGAGPEPVSALAATGAERLVVVRIREWQTMADVRVSAEWALEATVHDQAGATLGRRMSQGAETVGMLRVGEEPGRLAIQALSERLAYLLNDPEVTRALEGA